MGGARAGKMIARACLAEYVERRAAKMKELMELTIRECIGMYAGFCIGFVYEKFTLIFQKPGQSTVFVYVDRPLLGIPSHHCSISNLHVNVIDTISVIKNFISTLNISSLPHEIRISVPDENYIHTWKMCCKTRTYSLRIIDHYDIKETSYAYTSLNTLLGVDTEIKETRKIFEVVCNCILSIQGKSAGIIQNAWRKHVMKKRKKAALKVIIEFGLRPGHIIAKKIIERLNANR